MKKDKSPFRMLKGVVSLITANWGLKLLALALAIVVYYSMRPSDGTFQKTKFERTDERILFQP